MRSCRRVDHEFPPEFAKMLRVGWPFPYGGFGDPLARVEPMAVTLQPAARVVGAKPPPERNRLP